MQLTVVRHGQSYVNIEAFDSVHSMDAELTEKGQQQAEALANWLRAHAIQADALYSSSMRRAYETAQYLAPVFGLKVVTDDRTREISNCDTEGKALDEANLPRQFNPNRAHTHPFVSRGIDIEGGESWLHVRIRLGRFIDDLIERHYGQQVFMVAHGGIVSTLFDHIYNVGLYRRARTHTDNTGWSRFNYQSDGTREFWEVEHHNRVDHLILNDLL